MPVCIHLDTGLSIRPKTCTYRCEFIQQTALIGPTILDEYQKDDKKCCRKGIAQIILTDPGLSPEDCHLLPQIRPSGHKMTGGPPLVSSCYAIFQSFLADEY